MKVTFLGTGTSQGVPLIACNCDICSSSDVLDKRLRSSIMVEKGDFRLVIDSGPDFREQMLREHISSLDAVVFTHEHRDHIADLDDVRAFNYIQKKPMEIYGSQAVLTIIRQDLHYAFGDQTYPGVPQLNLNAIDPKKAFTLGPLSILPIQVYHHHMPVLGFRIGNFTYITDANHVPEDEKSKIIGSSILVLNALRHEEHISHFTLEQAISLADEMEVPKVYFTHISHQLGKHQEVQSNLPEGKFLAYDGLTLTS